MHDAANGPAAPLWSRRFVAPDDGLEVPEPVRLLLQDGPPPVRPPRPLDDEPAGAWDGFDPEFVDPRLLAGFWWEDEDDPS